MNPLARSLADEIANHDWSDAPWRIDRAGHQFDDDPPSKRARRRLTPHEASWVRTNVMLVTAQALLQVDPSVDLYEYAEACAIPEHLLRNPDGSRCEIVQHGIRWNDDGTAMIRNGSTS